MWSFLLYPAAAFLAYSLYDFFLVEKGPRREIDYIKVKKIYSHIRDRNRFINQLTPPKDTWANALKKSNLWITAKSLEETTRTVIHYKTRRWLDWYYAPEKIGENHVALPYYHNGNWYKAIISKPKERISGLTSICTGTLDVTQLVKPYLGPENNFGNIQVSPKMLGYWSLTIRFTDFSGLKEVTYNQDEIIDVSLFG